MPTNQLNHFMTQINMKKRFDLRGRADSLEAMITLASLVGREVTVMNVAYNDLTPGIQINLHGKLEEPDDDGLYHLRVKDDYNGTSGISFGERHLVREEPIYKQPSGRIEITLN